MKRTWSKVILGLGLAACLGGCQKTSREYLETQPQTADSTAADEKSTQESGKNDGNESSGAAARAMNVPEISKEEYPNVDGSTATLPLSQALYQVVTGAGEEEAQAMAEHTRTTSAYQRLIYGGYLEGQGEKTEDSVDLVIAYAPADSIYDYMEDTGIELDIRPIGKDALVFMTNEANPVESLTGQQLVDIYHGTIKNWSQAGGEDKEIVAFQRPEGSGSQTLMKNLVMKDVSMDSQVPSTQVIGDMGELIDQVASYNNENNALGYSVYFYARNMYQSPGLRFMKVDGVLPSNETIRSGEYPYVNEFYAAVRADEPKDSAAYQLFEWLTTDDGQALLEGLGYVAVKEPAETILLPDILKQETEPGKGNLEMKEDERFLIDRQSAYQKDGVSVMGPDWTEEKTLKGVQLDGQVKLVKTGEPAVLKNNEQKFGLYDIEAETWLLEPEYQYVEKLEDGRYRATANWGEGMSWDYLATWDAGQQKFQVQQANEVGDYLWAWNQEKTKVVITDRQGNLIKELNLQDYGNLSYGYVPYSDAEDPWYWAHYQDSDDLLFDERGDILLERSMVPVESKEPMEVLEVTRDRRFARVHFGMDQYIYDLEKKQMVSQQGEEVDTVWDGERGFYSRNQVWYDQEGNPLISANGELYETCIGNGYFSYYKNGTLVIEGNGASYQIPAEESDAGYARQITGNLFRVGRFCYEGETRRPELDDCYDIQGGQWILFQNDDGFNLLMDRDGRELYRSRLKESIIRVEDRYLTARRGSYFCVLDYNGQVVLQWLMDDMAAD